MSVITELKYIGDKKYEVIAYREYEEGRIVENGGVFKKGTTVEMEEDLNFKDLSKFPRKQVTINGKKVIIEASTYGCIKNNNKNPNDCYLYVFSENPNGNNTNNSNTNNSNTNSNTNNNNNNSYNNTSITYPNHIEPNYTFATRNTTRGRVAGVITGEQMLEEAEAAKDANAEARRAMGFRNGGGRRRKIKKTRKSNKSKKTKKTRRNQSRMKTHTRKNTRGGGMFNFLKKKNTTGPTETVSNLQAKRNYNLKHSKSKVANILAKPGEFKYTNKEAIRAKYDQAISTLRSLEKPVESISALRTVADKVSQALQSQEAKETGAVVITIPVGVAQLFFKVARVILAAFVFIFWDVPTMGSIPLSAYIMPNRGFNTTEAAYAAARRTTGANTGPAS